MAKRIGLVALTQKEKDARRDPVRRRANKLIGNRLYKRKHKLRIKMRRDERNMQFKMAHPKEYMIKVAASSAKKRNLVMEITPEDFEIPENCPILDIPLRKTRDNQAHPDTPSLDRVDNSKGYIKGNVRVISWQANRYKNNMSLDTIEKLYRYIKGEI